MRVLNSFFLWTIFLFGIQVTHAQIENDIEVSDSIQGNVEQEKFEQLLFKAISERGIEDYQKAINTLTEIEENTKDKVVVYFLLGQNFLDLEQYDSALINLEKARALSPNDLNITKAIFECRKRNNQFQSAIGEALVIAKYDEFYFEVIASMYLELENYEKALTYLDLSDQALGYSAYRDDMRHQIYKQSGYDTQAIKYYSGRETEEPHNPYNSYRLAFFQLNEKQYDEALMSLDRLKVNHPTFSRVNVLETNVYLKNAQPEMALKSLRAVVTDRLLEEKYKIEAIEVFKAYLEDYPEYQQEFINVLNAATQTAEDSASYLDLAEFYFKTDKVKSLENYYKALEQNPQNYNILSAISILNFELQNFNEVVKIADQALEIYPSQVIFMLYKGKSLLDLKQYEEAKSVLLEALDYMYEENAMMLDAYESLHSVYQALGDAAKALDYKNKSETLKSQLE